MLHGFYLNHIKSDIIKLIPNYILYTLYIIIYGLSHKYLNSFPELSSLFLKLLTEAVMGHMGPLKLTWAYWVPSH